jgi:hypothetical protein
MLETESASSYPLSFSILILDTAYVLYVVPVAGSLTCSVVINYCQSYSDRF